MSTRALGALLAAIAAATTSAHDFWISSAPTPIAVGDTVPMALRIGHGGHADPYAFNPRHCRRLRVLPPSGEGLEVAVAPGKDPAANWTPRTAGLHVVAYESTAQQIELAAEKFDGYLAEEGLQHVRDARAAAGDADRPGRERYARAAKSLVLVGDDASTEGFDRAVGLELELVPLSDPWRRADDEAFRVRLLWDGSPLADARVDAERLDATAPSTFARTDAEGVVAFADLPAGDWIFSSTYMVEAVDDDEAEWRSVWASLTCPLATPIEQAAETPSRR